MPFASAHRILVANLVIIYVFLFLQGEEAFRGLALPT